MVKRPITRQHKSLRSFSLCHRTEKNVSSLFLSEGNGLLFRKLCCNFLLIRFFSHPGKPLEGSAAPKELYGHSAHYFSGAGYTEGGLHMCLPCSHPLVLKLLLAHPHPCRKRSWCRAGGGTRGCVLKIQRERAG